MISHLRIFHSVCHREWGGLERRVFSECQWMSEKGHDIALAAPKGTPLYEKALQQQWRCYDISFTKAGMLKDFFLFRSALKEYQPHILNTHGNTDTKVGLFAAQKMSIPVVILSRHISPPVRNTWYNRLLYRDFCDVIFTTSSMMKNELIRDLGILPQKILTIGTGIRFTELPDRDAARRQIIKELSLQEQNRFIGYVGRLSPDKGLYGMIDAFHRIHHLIPNTIFLIVGSGDISADLQSRVADLGLQNRILLLGYRDNPWVYFRGFDCFVLASIVNEGIPQVILQAMAAECPVIGTNVGGIPDVICSGKTGLLVPPKDPDAISHAILQTLQDTEQTNIRIRNASEFVRSTYSLDKMGESILGVYSRFFTHSASSI